MQEGTRGQCKVPRNLRYLPLQLPSPRGFPSAALTITIAAAVSPSLPSSELSQSAVTCQYYGCVPSYMKPSF